MLLLFGCSPALGVNLNTKMIGDLIQCLYSRINWTDLSITFPTVIEQITSTDCNFEIIASNSIQKAKLFFTHNVATHTLSLTIHNTAIMDQDGVIKKKYGDEVLLTITTPEEVLASVNTVKTVLGISDAKVVKDGTKTEVIAAMNALQAEVDDF